MTKTPLNYFVLYFNLGRHGASLGGISPTNTPHGDGTGSRMLMDIRWVWTQIDTLNKWEENSSRHIGGSEEWTWIRWFMGRIEQNRIIAMLHSSTFSVTSLETSSFSRRADHP